METLASASLTTAFGNGFLAEFIRDSYAFIKNSSQFPQVQDMILQLDLKNFIPLSQKLIDLLKNKEIPPHVLLACNQFQASVNLIKDQLAFIHNILQNHKNKYLHRIRPPSLNKHLQKLSVLKNNADKQLNFLLLLTPQNILHQTDLSCLSSPVPTPVSTPSPASFTPTNSNSVIIQSHTDNHHNDDDDDVDVDLDDRSSTPPKVIINHAGSELSNSPL